MRNDASKAYSSQADIGKEIIFLVISDYSESELQKIIHDDQIMERAFHELDRFFWKGRQETARRLLEMGVELQLIVKATGLSHEEVAQLEATLT